MREYDNAKVATCGSNQLITRETVKQSLDRQRSQVQAALDNLDAALKFLSDNPNFEAFYDTMRKAGF